MSTVRPVIDNVSFDVSIQFLNPLYSVVYRALGMSKSEHTFEDLSLMKEAKRLGMPDVAGIVEFGRTARPFK